MLLSLGICGSLLEVSPLLPPQSSAIAQNRPRVRYKPKGKRPPLTHSEAGGTRNGGAADLVALTPLVSQEVLPQTTQAKPSFTWYLHNPQAKTVTLEFALIEPGVTKPLYRTSVKTSTQGVLSFPTPPNAPDLALNKPYRWSLLVVNNPQRTGLNPRFNGGILRVDRPSTVNPSASPIDQTIAYAEAGIWYDAIHLATQTRKTPATSEVWLPLLEQGGLKEIAQLERQ